ncbi:MAG: UDP-N-acetylmuramoyl-tripeptide--D-alanyl-D-alanine ligase [Candidatus Puniceispirillaceae bacterium]
MTAPLWTADDLIAGTGGTLGDPAVACPPILGIEIDSRNCQAGDLFVALDGTQNDGHEFIGDAAKAGAAACLVSRPNKDVPIAQIIVEDPLAGLARLGDAGRARFTGQMIGITGSVGKTGSKDMLAHAVAAFGKTHANQRSFNNHIGVPLTLASLPADADFAVQEMGMNAAGEIASLTKLARPDIALITRIASTHGGFFESLDDIAKAKAEIFQGLAVSGTAILNLDDPFYPVLGDAARTAGAARIITFGRNDDAEFCLLEARQHDRGMSVHAEIAGHELRFEMAMHGIHWAQNALGVLASVDALGLCVETAAARLASCPTPKGRGGRQSGLYHGCNITLIDDSYNASPASMMAAFASMSTTPPTIMILSEMRELGGATAAEHAALMPQINALAPRLVIALGSAMHGALDLLEDSIAAIAAADIADAVKSLDDAVEDGDIIFIKGSLGSGSWRVRDAISASLDPATSSGTPTKNGGNSHAA